MKNIEEIAGGNPFKVPENYFEDVSRKIIAATAGEEKEYRKNGLFLKLRPYLAAAASVAVLVAISFLAVRLYRSSDKTMAFPEISMEGLSESYFNDVDLITLEEAAGPLLFSEDLPDIGSNEIVDYLLLENVGINEIFELL